MRCQVLYRAAETGCSMQQAHTRFGTTAAAAAFSVAVWFAWPCSARASSKELGALRPFCGVNSTSCIQLKTAGKMWCMSWLRSGGLLQTTKQPAYISTQCLYKAGSPARTATSSLVTPRIGLPSSSHMITAQPKVTA